MGTLTPNEKTMRLQGYVRVTNNSGEDYENAQTRLIVGKSTYYRSAGGFGETTISIRSTGSDGNGVFKQSGTLFRR